MPKIKHSQILAIILDYLKIEILIAFVVTL